MKKKIFTNASVLVFLIFAFTACKKQEADVILSANTEQVTAAKGQPITHPVVSLKMTVRDAEGDKIKSDNTTVYTDGLQNVAVYFSTSGNLQFTTTANNRVSMQRHLNYTFDNPVPPARNIESGGFISTIPSVISPSSFVPQNMINGSTICITFSGGLYTLANGVVNFHRGSGNEDTQKTTTAYMYITRVDANNWTMAPVPPSTGGCSTISDVAALKISGVTNAYYSMPFSFLLTRK